MYIFCHTKMRFATVIILCIMTVVGQFPLAFAQDFQTLTLINVYGSKEAYEAAYPEFFVQVAPPETIVKTGQYFNFFDPQTGQLLNQIPAKPRIELTQEELESETEIYTKGYEYQIIANRFLVTTEHDFVYLKSVEEIHRFDLGEPQRQLLYNAHGEKIANLPLGVSCFVLLPSQQYLLAYSCVDYDTFEYLYFYHQDGRLVAQYPISYYPMIRYSSNGKYVGIYDGMHANRFYIFTNSGHLIFSGETDTYTQDQLWLNNFCIADDASYTFLTTDKTRVLIDRQGVLQWKMSSIRMDEGYFNISSNVLFVYLADIEKKAEWYSGAQDIHVLQALSLHDGRLIEEVKDISECRFVGSRIHLKRGHVYYEYAMN